MVDDCDTCKLIQRRDEGVAEAWDQILRTAHFDVVHSFNTSLPGWLVIVAKPHASTIAELSEAAAIELGQLLRDVSIALTEVTGCAKTYVMQFAESPTHQHVHFHVVPRLIDIPETLKGGQVFVYMSVPEDALLSDDQMNEVSSGVRTALMREGWSETGKN